MSKISIFVVTIIVLMLSATVASWNKALSEPFTAYQPKDGYTCEWAECRKPRKGPRLFHVRCKKTGGKDAGSYECVYKANPHCCKAYNKNQLKYYRSLARKAAENRQTACDQGTLTSDAMCEQVNFKQILHSRPSGNRWCVEYRRKKRDVGNEESTVGGECPWSGDARNMRDHNMLVLVGFILIAFMTPALW